MWQLVLSPQRFTSETTACLLTDQTNEYMIAAAEQELYQKCNLPMGTPLKQVKHCQ